MSYSPCASCNKLNRVSTTSIGKAVCGLCKRELPFHDGVNELNESEFSLLIKKSPLPVVADCWAPWCGPCLQFAPTFKQAAKQFGDQVVFAKVNTEAHPGISAQYRIRSIPTLIFLRNSLEVTRLSGALPLGEFTKWIHSLI